MAPFIYLGSFKLASYGLCIALGALFSFSLGFVRIRRAGGDAEGFLVISGYGILGGFLGAKLLYLLSRLNELDLSLLLTPSYPLSLLASSGFVAMGGLCVGLMFMLLGARVHRIALNPLLEKAMFVLPLSQAFGRIGCFLAGCCYGIHYDGSLAVTFPEDSFPGSMPRFPIQLVNATCLVVIAGALYSLSKTKAKALALNFYISFYCLIRFITEFWRGDNERGIFGPLSLSQYLCLTVLIVVGLGHSLRKMRALR